MPRNLLVAALLSTISLSACANPFKVFAPDEAETVRHGWFEPAPRPALAARHCYRTLAEVDCHGTPLPEEGLRRVGWFDGPVGE